MKTVQPQKSKERGMEAKLDKVKELLDSILIELQEQEQCKEGTIKASTLRRLGKMVEEIRSGKRETVKFRSIQELDRIVSNYKA